MTTPKHPNSLAIPREMDEFQESAGDRAQRVARLRWAVQAGAYDADPAVLAALMLCGPRAIFGAAIPPSRASGYASRNTITHTS